MQQRVKLTRKFQFPQVVAAVRALDEFAAKTDGGLWHLRDALLAECGPPGAIGVNNGSEAKLRAAAAELQALGHRKYCLSYLRNIRAAPAKILAGVSFWVHAEAGDAETLQGAKRFAGGAKLTGKLVKQFKLDRDEKAAEKERRENEKLGKGPRPDQALENAKREFRRAMARIRGLTQGAKRGIAPHIADLSQTERTELFNDVAGAAADLNALADMIGTPDTFQQAAE